MVLAVPTATLKEFSDEIYARFDIRVTEQELCKFFKRESISRKKVLSQFRPLTFPEAPE